MADRRPGAQGGLGPARAGAARTRGGGDRRLSPRLDKLFPVFLEGDHGPALGLARNLSAGGIFVETRDPQPLGSQVRVTFAHGDVEMTAVAEVRYVCHLVASAEGEGRAAVRGMGLRFLYFEATGGVPRVVH